MTRSAPGRSFLPNRCLPPAAVAFGILALGTTPAPAGLLVYEGFEYSAAGDMLHGQPDGSGTPADVDAVGLGGTWQDSSGPGASSDLFMSSGSLVFGDLATTGNHVRTDTNLNNDRFSRPITVSLSSDSELWFSVLASKLQNNFSAAEGGLVIGNQQVNNPRILLDDGTTGLAGFGVAPTTAGNNWTPYAWNGSAQSVGDAAYGVPTNGSQVDLLVGKISFDTGAGGADEYTLYYYDLSLGGGSVVANESNLVAIASTIEVDVTQADLDTLSLTRQVNTAYDEIRIAASFEDLLGSIYDDSDEDGIPDWWEIQYFGGPTAADADADLPDGDGLTNLEEYELGSNPNSIDTDTDGLLDGGDITVDSGDPRYSAWADAGIAYHDAAGRRTFRGESALGTDPANGDTDGDELPDGVETNTGSFVDHTDTGTNPLNPDTDSDGLSDKVETNTGSFSSSSDTGTNPLDADTDSDGAGDWYELTASLTNPFLPGDAPSIPYPLDDPDDSSGATDKPVKVFILSGQSNMVGAGTVSGSGDGTLETMTVRQNKFPNLIDDTGAWTTRKDVRYRGVVSDSADAQLSPGDLGSTFGPELGFGYIMGWYHDAPVLLLKSCIGNRSLGWDVLPPGSPQYEWNDVTTDWTYAGYGDNPAQWETGTTPVPGGWYAGKSYDTFFLDEADMGPSMIWSDATYFPLKCYIRHNGAGYRSKSDHTSSTASEPGAGTEWATYWELRTEFNVTDVLDNFATEYPQWAGQGFEIAGFVWWQGDKDRYDLGYATRYEQNLVNLINSLRGYYGNRYPGQVVADAPFVLATLGQTPLGSTNTAEKEILDAQLAVDGESGTYPQFAGNVKTVYSHPLSQGGASNSHYNGHALTYMLVGDALGRAMVDLLGSTTPTDYQAWADGYPDADLGDPDADFDGDGRSNDYERIWALDPTSGVSPAPLSVPPGAATGTFRYTRRKPALSGMSFSYEWSATLEAESWTPFTPETETADGASPVETVEITLEAGLLANSKLFVRVVATPN